MKKYPDVTGLFEAKERERKRSAQLSFDEKIAIVEQWQQANPAIDEAREWLRAVKREKVKSS